MSFDFIIQLMTLLCLTSPSKELANIDDDKAKDYIEKYKHIAVAEMDRTGIPASIKMAQAILESGVGESKLARFANNHFGIKCGGEDDWYGSTYFMWDDETVKSCFRVYKNPEESYMAHSQFLLNPEKDYRYGFLFKLDPKDYKSWAKGLQSSGYATSKTYTKNLLAIIERLELYKLDHLTSETLALEDGALAKLFPSLSPKPEIKKTDTTQTDVRIPDPFSSNVGDTINMTLTMNVFSINGLNAAYVQPKDDIEKIAMRYRVKARKLIRFNELKKREMKVGQYIFLEKKNNCYKAEDPEKTTAIHIVRQGQSMYDIAQLYGIKLRKLYRWNRAYKHVAPKTGVRIFLKKLKKRK